MLVSVSEDCMVKLWDIKGLKPESDYIEPLHTYRGHTKSLFAVTSNRAKVPDETLIYTAGQEGVIRIWKVPKPSKELYPTTNGENQCIGIFTSHKDVVW
jgi:WD40 repeat protein